MAKMNFNLGEENYGHGVTSKGRLTWDNDDHVARMLRGRKLSRSYRKVSAELYKLGKGNMSKLFWAWFEGEWSAPNIEEQLKKRYGHHGNGLQRAYIGTLLRNTLNRMGILDRLTKRGLAERKRRAKK